MFQPCSAHTLSVDLHIVHIACLLVVVRCLYLDGLAIFQFHQNLLEEGRTHSILLGARAYRVESHGREHIPGRCLAVVLITAICISIGIVELVHDFTSPILCLPGLAGPVVEIYHMLNGLVAMCILSHVHHLHLAHLMNHAATAETQIAGEHEHAVHHLCHFIASAHEFAQSGRIVEHAEAPVPTVAFAKLTAPVLRHKFSVECALFLSAAHEFAGRIIHIGIVESSFLVWSQFSLALAHSLTQGVDTPIVVSIFQCAGHVLTYSHVARYIPQSVIIVMTYTSRCGAIQMVMSTIGNSIPQLVLVGHSDSLDISIGHYRG